MTCMRSHLERTVYLCVECAGYNPSLPIPKLELIEKPTVLEGFEIGV